jgi:sigma-E factor negative regulatory protein RseA
MTEQELERLSALVDDEIPENEIPMEFKKLSNNPSSCEVWSHYHLIGDAMRGEAGPLYTSELAQTISRRLQDEPVVMVPAAVKQTKVPKHRTYTGFAVAASLAAVAVVLAPQMINQEGSGVSQKVVEVVEVVSQPPTQTRYVAENGTRWEMLKKPKVESRLNTYLVNHQEMSPTNNMKGIMPYANFVSYDENKQ